MTVQCKKQNKTATIKMMEGKIQQHHKQSGYQSQIAVFSTVQYVLACLRGKKTTHFRLHSFDFCGPVPLRAANSHCCSSYQFATHCRAKPVRLHIITSRHTVGVICVINKWKEVGIIGRSSRRWEICDIRL